MLDRDAPEHGLRAGDRAAVVELYGRTVSRRSSSNLQGRPRRWSAFGPGTCAPSP